MCELSARLSLWLLAILAALGVVACGEGGEGPPRQVPRPGEPVPPAVADAGELVGLWFRASDGPLLGIEFTDDGKAILTSTRNFGRAVGESTTHDFTLFEGGRLVVSPSSDALAFNVQVTGQNLRLDPRGATREQLAQSFVRLEGKSLAEALEEDLAQREAAHRKVVDAVNAILMQKRLVLADGDDIVAAIDIETADPARGVFSGDGYRAGPLIVQQASIHVNGLELDEAGQLSVSARLSSEFDPHRTGPAPATLTASLTPIGEGEALRLVGQVLSERNAAPIRDVELRPDAPAVEALARRFEAIASQRATKRAALEAALHAYVKLEGQYTPPGAEAPRRWTATIVRGEDGRFASFDLSVVNVRFDGDQAVLFLRDFGGNELRLRPAEVNGGPGFEGTIGETPITLAVIESMTAEQLAARVERVERVLTTELRAGLTLSGVVTGDLPSPVGTAASIERLPVEVTLRADEQGNLTGDARFPTLPSTQRVTGMVSVSGLSSTLSMQTRHVEGAENVAAYASQSWGLGIERAEPLVLSGDWLAARRFRGRIELRPAEESEAGE